MGGLFIPIICCLNVLSILHVDIPISLPEISRNLLAMLKTQTSVALTVVPQIADVAQRI